MLRKLLALFVLATISVSAIDLNARCWEVGGEALFWRAFGQPYDYGFDIVTQNDVRALVLKPEYDVGFRIFGDTYTHDCCHLFSVDWTHLRSTNRTRRGGTNIVIVGALPGVTPSPLATAHLKFAYDKVNVRAGRYVSHYCDSMFYGFGGLRYVRIERSQRAIAQNAGGNVARSIEKSTFEGGGFEVGAGAEIQEPWNIILVGRVSGVMLIGERKFEQATVANIATSFTHPTDTGCLVGAELRVGVKYRYECNCLWLQAEVGYQLDQYFDALRFTSSGASVTPAPTIPTSTTHNVGFGGPYISASIRW